MPRFYPVFLHLEGRRCVVVGGGPVAEQKVIGLLHAGARVSVISPDPPGRFGELAERGALHMHHRAFDPADLDGAFLVIVSTDDRALRHAVWQEAGRRGILINAVDDMPHCTFIAPAIYQQGDLTVAVSTAGKSPALAVWVRDRVGALLGPEYASFLTLLGDLREEVASRIPDVPARAALWRRIVESNVIEFIQRGDLDGARRRVAEWVREAERDIHRHAGPAPHPDPSSQSQDHDGLA